MLPAKGPPLGFGLSVSAPTGFLPPTRGTVVCTMAIVSLPFCSWALVQTSCPLPPAQTCMREVCFAEAQLWICHFLIVSLVCLFCLGPRCFGDLLKTEAVLARWRRPRPLLA